MHLYVTAFLVSSALASVLDPRAAKPVCSKVHSRCVASKQEARATAFCSSYLSIPLVTKSVTSTSFTSTVTVSPACATPLKQPDTEDLLEKRATVKKPGCLPGGTNSTQISSACSCYSITPATTTTTVASTQAAFTVTGPFAVQASGGNVNGQYFQPQSNGFVGFGGESSEETYTVDETGNLYDSTGLQGAVGGVNGQLGSWVILQTPKNLKKNSFYTPISCSINNTCTLDCFGGPFTVNGECSGAWYLSKAVGGDGCDDFTAVAQG